MFLSIFLIAGGLFAIISAIVDWDWFFEHPRAGGFVKLFGRKGARIFYAILGIVIIGLSMITLMFGL